MKGFKTALIVSAFLASMQLMPAVASPVMPAVPTPKSPGMPQPLPKPVKVKFCIFDPLGPNGKIVTAARELAKFAAEWNFIAEIKAYTDERVASEDFKAGQCEAVAISTLRAKQFNATVGSIDSPGNLRNYDEMKTLLKMLSNPVVAQLAINGRYQVAAVMPIGAIFVVVNDRQINSLSKAAGKRVVVLEWDPIQAKMISGLGAQPVPADFSTYAGKFNNGQADIIAAPALGFKPMELHKGIGTKGGVIRFPLLQATGTILIRRDLILPKIPDLDLRLNQVRHLGLEHIDGLINMLKEAENDVPERLWIDLPKTEQDKYYQMLREARMTLMRQGIYNNVMLGIMKRVRCKHVPSDAECRSYDE